MFVLILQPVKSSWDQTTLFANHVSSTACLPWPLHMLNEVLTDMGSLFSGTAGANLQPHIAADTDVDVLNITSASVVQWKDGECLLNVSVRVHILFHVQSGSQKA